MTATFQQAVGQAAWWIRYARDRAPDEKLPLGVASHLTAAGVQMDAVENLTAAKPRQPFAGIANL